MFPWATFRRTKGAVKVHVGLDHAGYLPTFVRVTNGKTSDIKAARALKLPPGSIMGTDIDCLAIGHCFLRKVEQDPSLKRGYADSFEPD